MNKRYISVTAIVCMIIMMFGVSGQTKPVEQTEASIVTTSVKAELFAGSIRYSAFDMNALILSVEESQDRATAEGIVENDGSIAGYYNVGICKVDGENKVNIREEASTESKVIGVMTQNAVAEVLDTEGDWYHIKSGKIEGFIHSDYLVTGDEAKFEARMNAVNSAVPTTDYLNVRAGAGTDYAILDTLREGESLQCLSVLGNGWVLVNLDGKPGYVSQDYVVVRDVLPEAMSLAQARYGAEVSEARVNVCEFALQFVGCPYVWAGTSLTNGVDCSGFTMKVYEHFGVYLPHYSGAQPNYGVAVKKSELLPGDLVFYANGSAIGHVGIYIGGGQIVHASNPRDGIKISPMNYREPYCYRRLIN